MIKKDDSYTAGSVRCVEIRDYIDVNRIGELEEELANIDYYGAFYSIRTKTFGEDKLTMLTFHVPLKKEWENQRRELRSQNRFSELIKKYGCDKSKRNKEEK